MIHTGQILRGDAKPAINININNSGDQAEARVTFLKMLVSKPIDQMQNAWVILRKAATGETWLDLASKTGPEIKEQLKNNPGMQNALDEAMNGGSKFLNYFSETGGNYLTMIKYAPYAIGILLVAGLVFAFKNPNAVSPTIKIQK